MQKTLNLNGKFLAKDEIRSLIRKSGFNLEDLTELDLFITRKIYDYIIKNRLKNVGLYYPIRFEVQINPLFNMLKEKEISIYLPKVVDDYKMEFIKIDDISQLIKGDKFSVYEPIGNFINKNELEAIFIPGISFDQYNYRVGRGKGYYDRYLDDFKGKKIGVAYSFLKVQKIIDLSKYDIKMDVIIDEYFEK